MVKRVSYFGDRFGYIYHRYGFVCQINAMLVISLVACTFENSAVNLLLNDTEIEQKCTFTPSFAYWVGHPSRQIKCENENTPVASKGYAFKTDVGDNGVGKTAELRVFPLLNTTGPGVLDLRLVKLDSGEGFQNKISHYRPIKWDLEKEKYVDLDASENEKDFPFSFIACLDGYDPQKRFCRLKNAKYKGAVTDSRAFQFHYASHQDKFLPGKEIMLDGIKPCAKDKGLYDADSDRLRSELGGVVGAASELNFALRGQDLSQVRVRNYPSLYESRHSHRATRCIGSAWQEVVQNDTWDSLIFNYADEVFQDCQDVSSLANNFGPTGLNAHLCSSGAVQWVLTIGLDFRATADSETAREQFIDYINDLAAELDINVLREVPGGLSAYHKSVFFREDFLELRYADPLQPSKFETDPFVLVDGGMEVFMHVKTRVDVKRLTTFTTSFLDRHVYLPFSVKLGLAFVKKGGQWKVELQDSRLNLFSSLHGDLTSQDGKGKSDCPEAGCFEAVRGVLHQAGDVNAITAFLLGENFIDEGMQSAVQQFNDMLAQIDMESLNESLDIAGRIGDLPMPVSIQSGRFTSRGLELYLTTE